MAKPKVQWGKRPASVVQKKAAGNGRRAAGAKGSGAKGGGRHGGDPGK